MQTSDKRCVSSDFGATQPAQPSECVGFAALPCSEAELQALVDDRLALLRPGIEAQCTTSRAKGVNHRSAKDLVSPDLVLKGNAARHGAFNVPLPLSSLSCRDLRRLQHADRASIVHEGPALEQRSSLPSAAAVAVEARVAGSGVPSKELLKSYEQLVAVVNEVNMNTKRANGTSQASCVGLCSTETRPNFPCVPMSIRLRQLPQLIRRQASLLQDELFPHNPCLCRPHHLPLVLPQASA